ncbi:ribosomal protein L20-like protein [Leptospira kirschneri str. 200801925]|nr:ribosomal protein L20-like protein [Leptospira kirschneri str. 200801925]
MPRAVNGTIHKNRRKRILKDAKGFRGARSKLYRTAKSAVMKAGQWAYRDRRAKKEIFVNFGSSELMPLQEKMVCLILYL